MKFVNFILLSIFLNCCNINNEDEFNKSHLIKYINKDVSILLKEFTLDKIYGIELLNCDCYEFDSVNCISGIRVESIENTMIMINIDTNYIFKSNIIWKKNQNEKIRIFSEVLKRKILFITYVDKNGKIEEIYTKQRRSY